MKGLLATTVAIAGVTTKVKSKQTTRPFGKY